MFDTMAQNESGRSELAARLTDMDASLTTSVPRLPATTLQERIEDELVAGSAPPR
jgi:hypothetical protein